MAKKLEAPPSLHANQGRPDHTAPNWVLQQSAEFAKEYRQMHGKPPIGHTKEYETDEYVYVVKYHHNQKGEVDRTIQRTWKGSYLLLFLRQVYAGIAFLVGGLLSVLTSLGGFLRRGSSSTGSSSLWGNEAYCPNCHSYRRRYNTDKFLKCHRCGWIIGYPIIRWLRYPTWLQYGWQSLKHRDGSTVLSAVLSIPFYPLRKIDPEWWRILPFKRQHTLLLGILLGLGLGYLLATLL